MKKNFNASKILLWLFLLFISITIFSFVIYTKNDNIYDLKLITEKLDKNNVPYKLADSTIRIPVNDISYIKIVRDIIINSDIVIDNALKLKNKIIISLKHDNLDIGSIEFYGINKNKFSARKSDKVIKNKNELKSQNKICIILDDAGYGNKNIYKIVKYPEKIAVAILPFQTKSRYVSHLLHNNGKEVMLHMPMEPKNYKKRKIKLIKNDLLSNMSEIQINRNITKMLNNIDYVKGVNNHQGSGLTANSEKMYIVLNRLAKENLYFIDSLTSNKSVSYKIGKNIGLMVGKRDIFLDNLDDYTYIKGQMDKLIEISLKRGYAIGIGHVQRKNTIKVLYDYINVFKDKNIELVYPSELLRELYNNKEVI